MTALRIGTSGWNYPTGAGTWNGVFYPPARERDPKFDELAFYARHFNTVEVNSTFYGQPRPQVSSSWARRTPAGFEFSVKLYQKFTHPKMYKARLVHQLETAADGADIPSALDALAAPTSADIDTFKRGIDPLADAGKLGALLAQFPPSFVCGDPQLHYLEGLLRAFGDYALAVELRHKSWSDRMSETLSLLHAHAAAWVQIDEPKFAFSIRQNLLPNERSVYYMRLHGRNARAWWTHAAAEDRYNYLYSPRELQEFADAADAVRQLVGKVYVYTNNHFSAKSVANAVVLKQMLKEPIDGEYPEAFLERYPDAATAIRSAAGQTRRVRATGPTP